MINVMRRMFNDLKLGMNANQTATIGQLRQYDRGGA